LKIRMGAMSLLLVTLASAQVPLVAVRGRVTGLPLGRTEELPYVLLTPSDFLNPESGFNRRVAADGSFEIPAVPSGRYTLVAWENLTVAPNRRQMRILWSQPVRVEGREIDDIELAVPARFELRGSLEIAEGKTGGASHWGVLQVCLSRTGLGNDHSCAAVNRDGAFVLSELAPDEYRLHLNGIPKGMHLKSIHLGEQEGALLKLSSPSETLSVEVTVER
jgi:hypothetical protein